MGLALWGLGGADDSVNHDGREYMSAQIPNIRLLEHSAAAKEIDLASELFHRINRIIPESQDVLSVPPDCFARDAIALLQQHGYSQMPVISNGQVLGVFSFRSFAKHSAGPQLSEWTRQRCAPGDLRVDDCLEKFDFASVKEEMSRVFDAMERDNGVLIGTPEKLGGILTPMDFLRYLYRVASPFVFVSEIELALRALIRGAMSEAQITAAAHRCLAGAYRDSTLVPTTLEAMTFDNYQSLVSFDDNWVHFVTVFGGTRARTSGKLKEIGVIRNDLFHFKREITLQDHETLGLHRDWLLSKVMQVSASLNAPTTEGGR